MLSPCAGPYPHLAEKNNIFPIRANKGDLWFNSERVMKAPFPDDLLDGVQYVDGVDSALEEAQGEGAAEYLEAALHILCNGEESNI